MPSVLIFFSPRVCGGSQALLVYENGCAAGGIADQLVKAGSSFNIDLRQFLRQSSDKILSFTTKPVTAWLDGTALSGNYLKGKVPSSQAAETIKTTIVAKASSGQTYTKTFNIVVKKGGDMDQTVYVGSPFIIDLSPYLEAPLDVPSQVSTEPDAKWIESGLTANTLRGSVASSQEPGTIKTTILVQRSNSEKYHVTFNIVIKPSPAAPDQTVYIGAPFEIDLTRFFKNKADSCTKVSTEPKSTWIDSSLSGDKICKGNVPASQATGTIKTTLTVKSASDGKTYTVKFNVNVKQAQGPPTHTVNIGASFDIDLSSYLRDAGDTPKKISSSPHTRWLHHTLSGKHCKGTVPAKQKPGSITVTITVKPASGGATYVISFTLKYVSPGSPSTSISSIKSGHSTTSTRHTSTVPSLTSSLEVRRPTLQRLVVVTPLQRARAQHLQPRLRSLPAHIRLLKPLRA